MASAVSGQRPDETQPLLRDDALWGPNHTSTRRRSTASQASSQATAHENSEGQRGFIFALAAAMLAFLVNGMTMSSLGVMVPYMQQDYGLSDVQVSAIFVAGPAGYCLSACTSEFIHRRSGRRSIALIGPICWLLFAFTAAARYPFRVLVMASTVGGFGGGLLDTSLNAWVGATQNANTAAGLLHGAFSAGAAIGPSFSGTLIAVHHIPWYEWYYVLAGVMALVGILLFLAFRNATAVKYRKAPQHDDSCEEFQPETARRSALSYPSLWIFALYLLAEGGTECTVTNWLVSFMIRIRGATPLLSSIASSGFWGGMAVGRLVLGWVTDRLGARLAITLYLLLALAVSGLFALVEHHRLSVALITLLGFLYGPLFPSAIVQIIQSLPAYLHVTAVSLVASSGQVGGAALPYALGAITERFGLVSFQYMLMIQVASELLFWLVSLKVS